MNTEILDDKDFKGEELKKTYPTLGARFIASILDVLIITVPIGLLSLANMVYLQSTLIACLLMLVFPFYKVYMEGTYGYTIGKKLQGFKIIKEGTENEEMDMKTSMLRYIFGFLVLLFSFIATFYTFQIITEGGWESFENFAESGANVDLLTELSSTNQVEENIGGTGLILPGKSDTVMIEGESTTCISVATMLANTNDAFAGINCVDVSELQVGQQVEIDMVTYDAGTEANNELINGGGAPGVLGIPAAPSGGSGTGGTGVTNTEENTMIHIHRGSIGDDDMNGGNSDLNNSIHRWLNPIAKLTIIIQ